MSYLEIMAATLYCPLNTHMVPHFTFSSMSFYFIRYWLIIHQTWALQYFIRYWLIIHQTWALQYFIRYRLIIHQTWALQYFNWFTATINC